MAVALLKEPPLSPCEALSDEPRVLPEIHLDRPAFWKEVEDRLGSR